MKRIIFLLAVSVLLSVTSFSQRFVQDNSWKKVYREFAEKVNDMVHTKLVAHFDYSRSQLNGEVWLTMKPHFYPVSSLQLDAKGMDIHKIEMVGKDKNTPLVFKYDSLMLTIDLGKTFTNSEQYTIYINYTAKPNELKARGSAAISSAKGLYFINPTGADTTKPIEIWTQGETESNSAWIPLIDKPNQKSTHEMVLIVPDKYVTLSNGKLVSQKKNTDGTRTDIWKIDQPIAPYLFFIGIGDYAIIKDSYKGKEVSYYVEKPYKDVARKIFGETPEMIRFYSQRLGVEYPWNKYAQMTARDYVSGAMENATATLHAEWAQQNARQLVDGNRWESTIAHELFHQWFGDLVTCESWSNLTVNESFADFSEGMWMDYRHGHDEGQAEWYNSLRAYLNSRRDSTKDLVRYYYADKEDMFDLVSYQKGGAILNMLRNYLGDEAFYQSLKLYLTRNSFGTGNARKLQQAFEDVSGKDLNWFFNEWYFGAGHPDLDISYGYDESGKQAMVIIKQLQTTTLFKLPVPIDVYVGATPQRYNVWVEHAADTFHFNAERRPDLINVDANKVLLAAKKDNKSLSEYIFQYQHGTNFVDRYEAIDFAGSLHQDPVAKKFLETTLHDPSYRLRLKAVSTFSPSELNGELLSEIERLAREDPDKSVKAAALSMLAAKKDAKYRDLFLASVKDSSYSVAGAAYAALIDLDEASALNMLPEIKKDALGALAAAVDKADMLTKTDADFDEVYKSITTARRNERFQKLPNFIFYLKKVNDVDNFKKGIDLIIQYRDMVVRFYPAYKDQIALELGGIKDAKEKQKASGMMSDKMDAEIQYLDSVMTK